MLITLQHGKEIGREQFSDDGHVLTSHISVAGSAATIRVDRDRRQVTVEQNGRSLVRDIPPGTLALENLNWAAYAVAAEQFPAASSATPVKVLIPSQDQIVDGTITVASAKGGGRAVTVTIGPLSVEVEVSKTGAVSRAAVPQQELEVRGESDSSPPPPQMAKRKRPAPDFVVEEQLEVESLGLKLSAVLWRPKAVAGPLPVVLIIGGSGAVDRDGNSPPQLTADGYRLLAEALAKRGIATLRYDKRGVGGSEVPADLSKLTFDDFVADAAAMAAVARQNRTLSKLFVLGHSEGGLVALKLAQRTKLDGLILASAAGRPLATLLREQLARQLPLDVMQELDALVAADRAGQPQVARNPVLATLFNARLAAFRKQWLFADPVPIAKSLRVPTLVIQGDNDLQVPVSDAKALAAARPGIKLVILPGVTHVWKVDATSTLPQPSYTDADRPIAPALVDAISSLLK